MYFDRFAGGENSLRRVLRKTIISSNRLVFDEISTVSSSSKGLKIFENQCTVVNGLCIGQVYLSEANKIPTILLIEKCIQKVVSCRCINT